MEIELQKLIYPHFYTAFQKLRHNEHLSAVLSFRLHTVAKAIDEHVKKYEELRMALIKKHGATNDDGSLTMRSSLDFAGRPLMEYVFTPEKKQEFEQELKPLSEEKVSLPDPVVKISELSRKIKLTEPEVGLLVGVVLVGE